MSCEIEGFINTSKWESPINPGVFGPSRQIDPSLAPTAS